MSDSPFDILAKGQIRNRVIETRTMRLGDLVRHPYNPKKHTGKQAQLLGRILTLIGWAGSALAWHSERNEGKLTIFDAHLRQTIAPDFEAPVMITDLTDAEADMLVALYDEVGRYAELDSEQLNALLSQEGPKGTLDDVFSDAFANMADFAGLYQFNDGKTAKNKANAQTGSVPTLEELEGAFGSGSDSDFWPVIKLQVSPETKIRFDLLVQRSGRETDDQKLAWIVTMAEGRLPPIKPQEEPDDTDGWDGESECPCLLAMTWTRKRCNGV